MLKTFENLKTEAIRLGNQLPVMPVDELRLAAAFSELPDQTEIVGRLIRELFGHPNMHVRRIAINACRRSRCFDVQGLKAALTEKLKDPEAWVRYDAAWAIHDAQFDSLAIRELLRRNAGSIRVPEDEILLKGRVGDAELQAKLHARKTLEPILSLAEQNGGQSDVGAG